MEGWHAVAAAMGSSVGAQALKPACCYPSDEPDAEPVDIPSVFEHDTTDTALYEVLGPEQLQDSKAEGLGLLGLAPAQPLAEGARASEQLGSAKGPVESRVAPGFLVCLERTPEAKALGVRVDFNDRRMLHIVRIDAGLVGSHNASALDGSRIRTGDFIVDVNGIAGDADAMMAALRETSALRLRVVPAMTFPVLVEAGELGVTFVHDPESTSLLVARVDGGTIGKYNSTAPEEKQVRESDRVCSVNGVVGTADSLLSALRDPGRLALQVTRPQA